MISEQDQAKMKGTFELKILISTARDNLLTYTHRWFNYQM